MLSWCSRCSSRDGPAWWKAEPSLEEGSQRLRLCATVDNGVLRTNSWLSRSPYPPPSPRRPMSIVVAIHKVAIGRVRLTAAVHRAIFGRRMTGATARQFPKWRDRMQKAAKAEPNVETGTRIVFATTRLVWHAAAGPGARAA